MVVVVSVVVVVVVVVAASSTGVAAVAGVTGAFPEDVVLIVSFSTNLRVIVHEIHAQKTDLAPQESYLLSWIEASSYPSCCYLK